MSVFSVQSSHFFVSFSSLIPVIMVVTVQSVSQLPSVYHYHLLSFPRIYSVHPSVRPASSRHRSIPSPNPAWLTPSVKKVKINSVENSGFGFVGQGWFRCREGTSVAEGHIFDVE